MLIWGLALVAGLTGGVARAELPPLIPREVLFATPDRRSPEISPDGRHLAYIAPHEGVPVVWVRTVGQRDDRPVTRDVAFSVVSFFWAYDNRHIVFQQDQDGKGDSHIHCTDIETGEQRDLTPFASIRAQVIGVSPERPSEILIGVNNRVPQLRDVYRVDLETGKLTLDVRNDFGFAGWLADDSLQVRGALAVRGDGGLTLKVRHAEQAAWRKLATWGPRDALTSGPISFTRDGRSVYVLSSVGANTGELRRIELATGREVTLASDDRARIEQVLIHPTRRTIQAVAYTKARCEWQVLDEEIADDFEAIRAIQAGDFGVINRDRADRIWLIYFSTDDGPIRYYAYDRSTRKAEYLFSNNKALEGVELAKLKPISFTARDGLTIHGYVMTPLGVPARGLPMVVTVHDGPWYRHRWGYDPMAQWLANRGYAVLQVNFRGSTGYGKDFLNAGNREWGGKMQDDLLDGVKWAIGEGIADPQRVGIVGTDYGGYAVLTALAMTPEVFRCGAELSGPTDLVSYMQNLPPHWHLIGPILWDRVGHPERDRELLESRSPIASAARVTAPLLIGQGGEDRVVTGESTRAYVETLRAAGRTVDYVEYADEGHELTRLANRLDFQGRVEKFLAAHLGGRFEP